MGTEGTWATQVDIVTTATVFEIPVYFCVKTRGQEQYVSKVIKPLKRKTQEMRVPKLPENDKRLHYFNQTILNFSVIKIHITM